MAVRHGYGKIAGTDALVFAYDTGDTRNSYRGEPTTNLYGNWNAYTGGSYEVLDNNTNYIKLLASAGTPWAGQFTAAVSAGTYTVSFQHRTDDAGSNNFNIDNDNQDDNIWNANITTTTEWQTYTSTKTHTGTGNHLLYFRRNGGAGDIYIRNVQLELKSHATPFVKGTRSSTQGLLDLTGNSSIDLSNVSFDSNAQPTFDGSNDYVDLSSATSLLNLGSTFSIEGILKLDNTSQGFGIVFSSLDVATGSQTKGVGLYWRSVAEYGMSANTLRLQLGIAGWAWHIFASNGISISDTNYHHVAVTLTGGNTSSPTIVFYIDGVAQAATKWTAGSTGAINNSSNANSLRLGSIYTASDPSYNNLYSAELLNVVKIYNRALTASEVANNYRQYKSRFNL